MFISKYLLVIFTVAIYLWQVQGAEQYPRNPLGSSTEAEALPDCGSELVSLVKDNCGGDICRMTKCKGCSNIDLMFVSNCDKTKDYKKAIDDLGCTYVDSEAAMREAESDFDPSQSKLGGECGGDDAAASTTRVAYIECAKMCSGSKDPKNPSAVLRPYLCKTPIHLTLCQCIRKPKETFVNTNLCPPKPLSEDDKPKPFYSTCKEGNLNQLLCYMIRIVLEIFKFVNSDSDYEADVTMT